MGSSFPEEQETHCLAESFLSSILCSEKAAIEANCISVLGPLHSLPLIHFLPMHLKASTQMSLHHILSNPMKRQHAYFMF